MYADPVAVMGQDTNKPLDAKTTHLRPRMERFRPNRSWTMKAMSLHGLIRRHKKIQASSSLACWKCIPTDMDS